MTHRIRLRSRDPSEILVLVNVAALEEAWKRDHGFYIRHWRATPRIYWFDHDSAGSVSGFFPGTASIDPDAAELVVSFNNGRHRTRWLIESGVQAIPLCIPKAERELWRQQGLIDGRVRLRFFNLPALPVSVGCG